MQKYCGFAQFSRYIGGTGACLVLCCVYLTAGCTYHKCMHWHSWLIHCTASQKVTGSVPDRVVRIFRWPNPLGCNMAQGSTQPLTEMSTRDVFWRVNVAGA